MPMCAYLATPGYLSYLLVRAQAAPCPASDLVLLTAQEYEALQPPVSPFAMSPADGLMLGGAIVSAWAAAFAVRAVIRALNAADPPSSYE